MAWLEAVSTAITVADVASKAAEKSNLLAKNFSRILYWIKNGKTVLPVFGAGGVGKSTIGKILLDESKRVHGDYEESLRVEEIDLDKEIPARILVAPGQVGRVDFHWQPLFDEIVNGRAIGVINVVSYGYHALGIQHFSDHEYFKEGDTSESFCERYSENRRNVEVELLEAILSSISSCRRKIWFITIINKQDLWYAEEKAVKLHYEQGAYGVALEKFSAKMGSSSFQHDFIPASLTMQNLETASNEMLKATSAGYDLGRHNSSLNFLLKTLGSALEAGKSKK